MTLTPLLLRFSTESSMEDLGKPRLQVQKATAVVEADCSPDHKVQCGCCRRRAWRM